MAELSSLTLVAGMKRLKLIKKRMQSNSVLIQSYASQSSTSKPLLGSDDLQKKEIKGLIQANKDLAIEYERIHRALTYTNIMTNVKIGDKDGCINDFLILRRELFNLLKQTHTSLNDSNYKNTIGYSRPKDNESERCVFFYDEKTKQDEIRRLDDLFAEIDSRLENINATSYLMEVPSS